MHAVILERNKLVGRRVARMLAAAGTTTQLIDDPSQLIASLPGASIVCADAFDGDLVAEQVRAHPGLRGILWTAEPLRRSLKYMIETTAIDHVLGRKDFETPPRSWEVVMIARRLASTAAPPFAAYFDWGATLHELPVRSTTDRDVALGRIGEVVAALGVPRRVVEMVGELGHELIMNALYDAPVDAHGRPKHAADRKSEVVLDEHERPTVIVGTDGMRLGLRVRDPFGRLERRHVVDGLARGLAGGEQDRSRGGAGLGMLVCHQSSSALIFDVAPGRHTEVTALLDLDLNLREFRSQAKSLHFWSS